MTADAPHDIAKDVERAILPVLERDGFEIVLCEFVARQKILRLFIDHERGVTVDDCATVSRMVSDLLDAEGVSDRISGRYHLEVSSPGLDRPLVKPAHFARFVGRRVQVTTEVLVEGRRNFSGELVAANEQEFEVVVDARRYAIAYGRVARAKLVPEL